MLGNRAVSVLAVLLVGFLTLRARVASERAARLAQEEKQLARERALRQLAENMGGPLGQAEFVERAALALRHLSGASHVEIAAVDRAIFRVPHAVSATGVQERPALAGTRVPLEFLAQPAGAGNVWAVGERVLGRLHRPAEGDLLVIFTAPAAPLALLEDAVRALQPLLERTALLDDLRAGRALLAQRGEVLRDLVYAFSHDLRTPLLANAMNMRAALKGAFGPLPEKYRATLHNGLSANETLLGLADQLLLLAKYEGGEEGGEELDDVNLRDVALRVLADVREQASARRVTLETELEGVHLAGRRHDLRRAVQNLVDNAVKFSPPGGTVCVTLDQGGDQARLTVQDEGAGVSPSREATLFQRFRGSGAGSGTGLGLYLTRRIAEAHGGTVRYVRTAGARTRFTLSLPLGGPRA
ncbi:sensor histidine kinase [Deinococcus irradiatisoli]|uniref:sensor histidine kinase n=1 Tax=Deinococcus irradiatisoli TaxID=2202254 RepID=UPI001FE31DFA|nr:HAMP domain-containing sensor histidine kinase [Deinococcus irradiatisoli]